MLTNLDNVKRFDPTGGAEDFSFDFPYWSKEEIKVYLTNSDQTITELTIGTDYTLTDPDPNGGTVHKVSAWTGATILTVMREVELTQEVDLINGEKIDGEQLEEALDLKAAGLQQMQEQFTRTVKTSLDEVGSDFSIPNKAARIGTGNGTLMGFDGTGEAIVLRDLKQFDIDVAATASNASAASESATLAQKWAENPEDTPVVTGSYSALHHANKAKASATSASTDATTATNKALDAEAWAVGQRNGTDVPPTDPTYHNSSKYYHDIITQIISGALRYQGTWTTTGATDYSAISTPRLKGDMFYCQGTACTIDGVTYTQGDLIIFNSDVAQGTTITTSMIDKIDNTETVTPDNTCTLSNKTIAFGSNTMTDVASTNTSQTLTNKTIAYDDNTLTGVQPTLTAGTGIDITGTTISLADRMSTTERFTGRYDAYGRPIYQKIFEYPVAMDSTAKTWSETLGGNILRAWLANGSYSMLSLGGTFYTAGTAYYDSGNNFMSLRINYVQGQPNINLEYYTSYYPEIHEVRFVVEYIKGS